MAGAVKTLWVIATLAVGDKCPCDPPGCDRTINPPVICLKPVRDGAYASLSVCEYQRKQIFGDNDHYQCVDIRSLFK